VKKESFGAGAILMKTIAPELELEQEQFHFYDDSATLSKSEATGYWKKEECVS